MVWKEDSNLFRITLDGGFPRDIIMVSANPATQLAIVPKLHHSSMRVTTLCIPVKIRYGFLKKPYKNFVCTTLTLVIQLGMYFGVY